jgi:hypothetical protein
MDEGTVKPPLDPAAGTAANVAAGAARDAAEASLKDGSLDLVGLFAQERAEEGTQLGHMNIKRALVALPHIGDVRADEILASLGIEGGRNLDTLGAHQREAIEQAVSEI